MSDQFWLTKAQLKRMESHFPKSRGVPRADDRRVVSGIIHVIAALLDFRLVQRAANLGLESAGVGGAGHRDGSIVLGKRMSER
jgi:hypothetical protein